MNGYCTDCRGGVCPPNNIMAYLNNTMEMIWHDNMTMQNDMWKFVGKFIILLFYHCSCLIRIHHSIFDFAKQMLPVMGAYRNEI